MRQHNGARVLSSDVSSGPDLRPPWSLVRTGDRDPAMPRPENATIGIPQSCRYALRASALARSTEAQMSLFLLDEACIVCAI